MDVPAAADPSVAPEPLIAPLPPDARKAVWTEGLERLQRLTGKPNGSARGLLGKLLSEAGDDCAGVLAALRDCPETGDPIAWLMAAAKARCRTKSKRATAADHLAALGVAPDGSPLAAQTPPQFNFEGDLA
jgi:hypothetical protein